MYYFVENKTQLIAAVKCLVQGEESLIECSNGDKYKFPPQWCYTLSEDSFDNKIKKIVTRIRKIPAHYYNGTTQNELRLAS
jgi:hypothetical protein